MELFLIRHALAEEPSLEKPDSERRLIREGVRRFKQEVTGMERLELGFDRVLHSPLLRAVETARLLEPLTRGDGRVETELLAREPEERLLALLSGLRVAVVGHEPYLGALVSWLVMGKMEEGERFPFKKGGLYWLEGMVAPGGMKLKAALPPKVLRGIGGFGS